jgi:DGQHR domain-containing protein
MTTLTFTGVLAAQSPDHQVVTFAATAEEILRFAQIERVSRDEQGDLFGFQRPQIAGHIREIQDYLAKPDSILPNAVVVAFTDRVKVELDTPAKGLCRMTIELDKGVPGLVVDGQQRLTALSATGRTDFQVFVSAMICRDEAELRRQFVLINNTRPLPKSLIYELLPTVTGLPPRLETRSAAASLTARLNNSPISSLRGQISQHTNPVGMLSDNAIQKVFLSSLSDGVMREMVKEYNGERNCVLLVSEFFEAVRKTFPQDWYAHKPSTSRLVGGVGIQSMGYVMELLAAVDGARKEADFITGLECLKGKTAWSSGSWDFGDGDVRHWKALQNVNRDVLALTHYLTGIVRADARTRKNGGAKTAQQPLLAEADS